MELYEDEGGPSSSARSSEELSQVFHEIKETDCEESELIDASVAVDFAELHVAIEKGELETVKSIVEIHEGEQHFTHDGVSALYKAYQSKEYKIIAFLIHSGAKFVGYEDEDVYRLNIDMDLVNYHLYQYNRKSERSCVYRLMSISQSPQDMDAERHKAVMAMYEYLYETEATKSLLKVLQNVDFDVVFDFKSDTINRVHRLYKEEAEVFGLALTDVREIYIGALNLLSDDHRKRAKVYGVVAEELCHLALTIVFQNDAKPYREEDSSLIQEFKDIVLSVKSLKDRLGHIESVIWDIYGYDQRHWECELIARVPHVIGIYGEESGKRIFQESSKLYRLLIFYENNVLPKCRDYVERSLNKKFDRIIEQTKEKNDFISFKEKRIKPLKEDFRSFRDCAVVEEGVHVISTNCIKLCALHVYHELKPVYGDQLERNCVFFDSECFEKKRDEIVNALKCKLCDYLVLVLDDKDLHHRRLLCEYLDHFEELKSEGINVIVISNSQFLGPEFEDKFVEYKWDDLTDEYKDFRTTPLEYIFKREREIICIKKEVIPHHFSEEDITQIINGDLIEVRDGVHPNCQDYNPKTYVERQFRAIVIDRNVFKRIPEDSVILIHGLQRWECKEMSINENQVQWLEGPGDEIQKNKVIFICNNKFPMNFEDFVGKTTVENRICLKYDSKMFYLMNSEGNVFKQYENEMRQTEEEMIVWLKNNKSLIVSENAGCGKSTVMSRLIRRVKERIHNSWVLSVDLNKFSIEDKGSDMYEDIFLMFEFKNGFERCHFRKEVNRDNCFVFLDAFDEIPSEYKSKALKLICFLRNETSARIIITTRMHHQKELEETLNTFSHQLVPFDNSTQVTYLGNLWKWKLKFPNGEGGQSRRKDKEAISKKIKSIIGELEKEKAETGLVHALKEINLEDSVDSIRRKIDGLDLNALADSILQKTSLDEETLEFMGIPLHLFMTGVINWDGNFHVSISSGIHSMYTQFIARKVVIYVEDKENMPKNRFYDAAVRKTRNDAYRIHIRLAKELFEEGKMNSEMSEDDLELCKALGVVFIKGEDVEFLHLTFAEYFVAESIHIGFDRGTFKSVLFNVNFTVVRRFLENSLKGKNFENLSEEVLIDLDFLLQVLNDFVEHYFISAYDDFCDLYSKSVSSANIIKCLLKTFEETVDSVKWNAFVQKIEDKLHFEYWYLIGGCITVNMTIMLLNRNFNKNSKIIFAFFGYTSDPKDAIEILNKCISTSEFETNEGEKGEKILRILEITDRRRRNLFDFAMFNERIEVLVRILKHFKEILGNETFINKIVKSEEYWIKILDNMIEEKGIYKVIELMKALYSDFGDEIEVLFEEKDKIRIIRESIGKGDEYGNALEETINAISECFGIENLKKILFSCDYRSGEYLIHHLVYNSKNAIENHLKIIEKYLNDKSEIQQFLMFENRKGENVFNLAFDLEKDNLSVILTFYSKYFKKEKIKEMMINYDGNGRNVLYSLFKYNSSEEINENLNLIKDYLDDEKLFKELLKSKDKYSNNIFYSAAKNRNELNISFLNSHLSETEIKELMIERNKGGQTFLHYGADNYYLKNFLIFLKYSFEMMKDKVQFEELILAKHYEYKFTFLHDVVRSYHFSSNALIEIIKSVKEKVSEECFKELLRSRDYDGETFLQIRMRKNRDIIKEIEKVLEKEFIKELLKRQEYSDSEEESEFISSDDSSD